MTQTVIEQPLPAANEINQEPEPGSLRRRLASFLASGLKPVSRALYEARERTESERDGRLLEAIANTSLYTVGVNNGMARRFRRLPQSIYEQRSQGAVDSMQLTTPEDATLRAIIDRAVTSKIKLKQQAEGLRASGVKELVTVSVLDKYEAERAAQAYDSPPETKYVEISYNTVGKHDYNIDYSFVADYGTAENFLERVKRKPALAGGLAEIMLDNDRLSEDATGRQIPAGYPGGMTQNDWKLTWNAVLEEAQHGPGDLAIRSGYGEDVDYWDRLPHQE